jgi:hypothetical protein
MGVPPDHRVPRVIDYQLPLIWAINDLRHAAVSLWLNSGVPATEVASRAGHGVAVLLKIYAHCTDGQSDAASKRIAGALEDAEDDGKEADVRCVRRLGLWPGSGHEC